MKVTVDSAADALYIEFGDASVVETRQVSPGVLIDFGEAGRLIGIELLSISTKLHPEDLRCLAQQAPGETN